MNSLLRVLVIGGVATGPKTASRLRRLMPEAEITLIDRDSIVSYGACGLPYYVEGLFEDVNALIQTPVGVPRTPVFFEKVKGFTVLTRTEAFCKVSMRGYEAQLILNASGYDRVAFIEGGIVGWPFETRQP